MNFVKSAVTLISLLQSCFCFAGAHDCGKWEYAKFKDATRTKLTENYCDWKGEISLVNNLIEIEKTFQSKVSTDTKLESQKKVVEMEADQKTCESQASEASDMLSEKYKAKPPTTMECACLGSGSKTDVDACRKRKSK